MVLVIIIIIIIHCVNLLTYIIGLYLYIGPLFKDHANIANLCPTSSFTKGKIVQFTLPQFLTRFATQVDVKAVYKVKARKVNFAFITGHNRLRCL